MPISAEVRVTKKDTRTIELPVPCTPEQTAQVATLLGEASRAGFGIKTVGTRTAGDQRDPFTIGLRLTLERNS